MYVKDFNYYDNSLFVEIFFSMIEFIKNKNSKINIEICLDKVSNVKFKKDSSMFSKCGQFLMFLYIFKIDNLSSENIYYSNGKFFLSLSSKHFNQYFMTNTGCEDIANDIINCSTYKKDCIPKIESNTKFTNKKDFKDFENGFISTYKTFIHEKNNIIEFLTKYPLRNFSITLIKNIKLLNPRDLHMQLKFIKLRYLKKIESNYLLNKLSAIHNYNSEFISLSKKFLDFLTQNSIIGMKNNSLELTFIGYINNELRPVGINNIYISIYFSFIAKITQNKYYEKSALYSLMPVINSDNLNYNKEILKLIYLLNSYIHFEELDKFIHDNICLFEDISSDYKNSCMKNPEKFILMCVREKSFQILKSLFLV